MRLKGLALYRMGVAQVADDEGAIKIEREARDREPWRDWMVSAVA